MVGSALCRALKEAGFNNVVGQTRDQLDLRNQEATESYLKLEQPDIIIIAAAKVGGIDANRTQPADFLLENQQIQTNLIHGAHQNGVSKLLFLGSSCMYPRLADQPLKEGSLCTGSLEPTNEGYATAKVTGWKMCQAYRQQYGCDFISAIPTNLYGLNDHYEPGRSHVIPALISKYHQAKIDGETTITNWGTGDPRREFLNVDDAATGCVHLLDNYSDAQPINIAGGTELSIRDLNEKMVRLTGYSGEVKWDTEKPDGMPRKLLDDSRLKAMGWKPKIDFESGLKQAYEDYLERFN
jgi:GDP-L-fucose synthase